MAGLNITLNQEEILQLLSENSGEKLKLLLQDAMNAVLKAESSDRLHAERYERTDNRTDSRNGSRDRNLLTRVGRITLHVPRHRNIPFKTMLFENYSRSETALIVSMAEMVVNGVSTRKVSKVMETLCGATVSKSAVSDACKDLDKAVREFRSRPLEECYPFLTVDATYFKVRENNRIISKALMVALGTNEQGRREVIGFGVFRNESTATWTDFLMELKNRGLREALMITSDAHEGIQNAIAKVFPNVPWQRCQFHFSRNITDKAPKKWQKGLHGELQEMFNSRTIKEARKKRDDILKEYGTDAESAMKCLDEGFESAMTVMSLPIGMRRFFRTSNPIERLNGELKRRSKVIGIFPNEESLLRLMGSVLIEQSETMSGGKALFSKESPAQMMKPEIRNSLILIAEEQINLLAA